MNELSVGSERLSVTVKVPEGMDPWPATRAAYETALKTFSSSLVNERKKTSSEPQGKSQAAQIRGIAREILADGRVHENREITKAAREAGIPADRVAKSLASHFEKGRNGDGRPTWRDPTVPSGYADPRAGENPAWARTEPAHDLEDLDVLSRNGSGP